MRKNNNRSLCVTSTTLDASWHSDFAKTYNSQLIQIEAQFGKVESMFKDFCGFRIARYEKRLALGIEIVLSEPSKYFSHRKNSIGGMAYFIIARNKAVSVPGRNFNHMSACLVAHVSRGSTTINLPPAFYSHE
jgi:hypothetical protein